MNATHRYLENLILMLERLRNNENNGIEDAAKIVARTIESKGVVHVFGTGHSHMLAEELFYRAGGLVQINPILDDRLMLHKSAHMSTQYERQPGLAAELIAQHHVMPNDCFIIASNSGGNAVVEEIASMMKSVHIPVIAITSLLHATDPSARTNGVKLHNLADVVIDNLGVPGDASIKINEIGVGPTSSVIGCAIVNSISTRAVEILSDLGINPPVFMSSNTEIGDIENQKLVHDYSNKIKAL